MLKRIGAIAKEVIISENRDRETISNPWIPINMIKIFITKTTILVQLSDNLTPKAIARDIRELASAF